MGSPDNREAGLQTEIINARELIARMEKQAVEIDVQLVKSRAQLRELEAAKKRLEDSRLGKAIATPATPIPNPEQVAENEANVPQPEDDKSSN